MPRMRTVRIPIAAAFIGVLFFASYVYAEEYTIRMTSEGFAPADIEIQEGDSIRFLGDGESGHWVASDKHPTHTIYPGSDIRACDSNSYEGFDACRPIFKGGEFTFAFLSAGTWRFHDHLNPEFTGNVIVRTNATTSQLDAAPVTGKKLSAFDKLSAWFLEKWYSAFPEAGRSKLAALNMINVSRSDADLEYWMRIFGYESTLDKLVRDAADPGQRPQDPRAQIAVGECHTEAHFLGRIAFKLFGLTSMSERMIDTRCQFGFYHGVIESSLGETGDDAAIQKYAEGCTEPSEDPLRGIFCEHVIGHGLMVYHSYDLPFALTKCRDLISYERGRKMCYHGAFMENVFVTFGFGVSGHTTRWIDPDRPDFPCDSDALPDDPQTKQACYFNQSLVWSSFLSYDESLASAGCLRAPASSREMCFYGVGFNIALPMMTLPDETVAKKCLNMPTKKDRKDCLLGALFMRSTHWNTFEGFRNPVLCKALEYDDLDACHNGATRDLAWILDAETSE